MQYLKKTLIEDIDLIINIGETIISINITVLNITVDIMSLFIIIPPMFQAVNKLRRTVLESCWKDLRQEYHAYLLSDHCSAHIHPLPAGPGADTGISRYGIPE